MEDFENAGLSIIDTSGTDTIMKFTTTDVFEGTRSGIVNLDATKILYEGRSSASYTLPKGSPVFLELNYKTNNFFVIGVYASNSSQPIPVLYIKPVDKWNKIYIELTPAIRSAANSNPFRIFIGMKKDDIVSSPQLLIDNIKLLH